MDKLNKNLKETSKTVDKLGDNLDKVNVKTNQLSVSAKDVAVTYKKEFQDVMNYITLQMSKIGAIITEMNTHVGQAIDKNIEAGDKVAQKMEKSAEKSISVVKVKAIETEALLSSIFQNSTSKAEEQSAKLAQRVSSNKELLENTFEEINKKYDGKEIGFFNLKAHKKNVEGHIGELKKHKTELEVAKVHTSMQYNAMMLHYDKDSAEFKKAQEEKKIALEALQIKVTEVDTKLKESNSSYLAVWKKQHGAIGTELTKLSTNIEKTVNDNKKGFNDFIEGVANLKKGIETLETEEKALNKAKYDKKAEKLEKELAKVKEEVTKNEKEKTQLEEDQAKAQKQAEKYKNDIKEIEKHFINNSEANESNPNTNVDDVNQATTLSDGDDKQGEDKQENIKWLGSEEEIEAAQKRITELKVLADAEEKIVTDKQTDIENANEAIANSERSVLLEQMRIADEKTKLEEDKVKKDEEIAEKAKKRKEKLEKLEKIKAKAQQVVKIAEAVSSVAKGVATAWGLGPFIGPPMAALVAVQGAMQIKTMTEQLKYMEDGGLLRGKRHAQGGMRIQGSNIEVEGGEYVVNRQSTDKNLGLLGYINSQRRELDSADLHTFFSTPLPRFQRPEYAHMFESGGQVPMLPMPESMDVERLLAGMEKIKIDSYVSVTDINTVQQNMARVDEWTGL